MPALSSKANQWQPGQRVGRYTVLGHLASGGMAEIFLARPTDDPTGRRLIALKRINDEFAADIEFVTMFLDEARIGLQLTHPHLIRTYGLDRDGICPYLALEYLSGESLQDLIEISAKNRRPIPPAFLARWIADAAQGLHHAHLAKDADGRALRIVHRDISPHNLFITYRGKLKVVDFGIAAATIKSSHTQTGFVKGKLAYLSPEQVTQAPVTGRTDVFALGIVLFEALTLSPLFADSVSDTEIVETLCGAGPLERVRERVPSIPVALDAIVARAMAMDASERYGSAKELQEALEGWLADQGEQPTEDELGALVRDLYPERMKRKDALVRTSLGTEARRQPHVADEATATDIDLTAHPELMRLASNVKAKSQARRSEARTEPSASAPPQASELSPRMLVGVALLGIGTFALTVLGGSSLGGSHAKARGTTPALAVDGGSR